MADKTGTSRALNQVNLVEMLCQFLESDALRDCINRSVPVSMPLDVGSLGVDVHLWCGLGTVGLWAALDAVAERAGLPRSTKCTVCSMKSCIHWRFQKVQHNQGAALEELEDLRHLYAHNFGGDADQKYFDWSRHVLKQGVTVPLSCGATFDGYRIRLTPSNLRHYAQAAQAVLILVS